MTTRLIICVTCGKLKPYCAVNQCKACYDSAYKRERRVTAKPGRVQPSLGKCQCGQPAVKRMFLKFGLAEQNAVNGDWYNLCERCAELEAEQAGRVVPFVVDMYATGRIQCKP